MPPDPVAAAIDDDQFMDFMDAEWIDEDVPDDDDYPLGNRPSVMPERFLGYSGRRIGFGGEGTPRPCGAPDMIFGGQSLGTSTGYVSLDISGIDSGVNSGINSLSRMDNVG